MDAQSVESGRAERLQQDIQRAGGRGWATWWSSINEVYDFKGYQFWTQRRRGAEKE
jgi:hypothetical protein